MRHQCPRCGGALDVKPRPPDPELPRLNPLAWQTAVETAVVHLANLLYAAGERPTVLSLVELVRQLPRCAAELGALPESFFRRCLAKAFSRRTTWRRDDREEFKHFVRDVARMLPEHRALFEASVAGALAGYGRAV